MGVRMPARGHGAARARCGAKSLPFLELFVDSGETLTLRCYPTGEGPWTILSRGLATDDVAVEVEAHTLRPPESEENDQRG